MMALRQLLTEPTEESSENASVTPLPIGTPVKASEAPKGQFMDPAAYLARGKS